MHFLTSSLFCRLTTDPCVAKQPAKGAGWLLWSVFSVKVTHGNKTYEDGRKTYVVSCKTYEVDCKTYEPGCTRLIKKLTRSIAKLMSLDRLHKKIMGSV